MCVRVGWAVAFVLCEQLCEMTTCSLDAERTSLPGVYDEPDLVAAVVSAVTPAGADLIVGREVVLRALTQGSTVRVMDLVDAWLNAQGVSSSSGMSPDVRVERRQDHPSKFALMSDADPMLMTHKADRVIAQVLAELLAEGVVTFGRGDAHNVQSDSIRVRHDGGSGAVVVPNSAPLLPPNVHRYQLVGAGKPFEELLPTVEMLVGLADLLGARGEAAVRESRGALAQGLYLASASLLASASEAAWFTLGRAVPDPTSRLRDAVDSGQQVAVVIEAVVEHARRVRAAPGVTLNELLADAHRFRDIRNYALHPVEDHDADRESWLTQTGATVLMLSARRYLVKLADLLDRLNAGESPAPSG